MGGIATPQAVGPLRAGVASSRARLTSALRPDSLDRALVAGQDPAHSRALALRAARLTSMRRRSQLAAGIERLAVSGAAPRRSILGGPAHALAANSDRLTALAALLRDGAPLYAAGVARLRLLLTDPTSPAHTGDASALAGVLEAAGRELAGHPVPARIVRTPPGPPQLRVGSSQLLPGGRWVHGRREGS